MTLAERKVEDKIEICGKFKHIQVRTSTIIERDGVEISRSFHRHVISPFDDVSGESADVQGIASVVHNDELKSAYQAYLDAQTEV